jgi:phage terminase small subunit
MLHLNIENGRSDNMANFTCRHFCDAWEIYQRQVQHVRGVDLQVNSLVRDAFVLPRNAVSFFLDLVANIVEVVEFLAG